MSVDEEAFTEVDEDEEAGIVLKRNKQFHPTRSNIRYVCMQIRRHDLGFLHSEVFPEIPTRHIYECMKIIWEHTYMLTENPDTAIQLPPGMLNIHPFRQKRNNVAVPEY